MDKAYSKVIRLFEEFRKFDSGMPIQTAITFCMVANNEGISMKELQEKMGYSQSSCHRNVTALCKYDRFNKPAHDLLYKADDPMEHRRKLVFMTPKGKRVAETLKSIVGEV